jgi:hypothetical protein
MRSEADPSASEAERLATMRSHSLRVGDALAAVAARSGSEKIHFINEKNVLLSDRNAFICEKNDSLGQDDHLVDEKVEVTSVGDAQTMTKNALANEIRCSATVAERSATVNEHALGVENRFLGEAAETRRRGLRVKSHDERPPV